ncbi:lipopolysaccharide biosynthesis protein [Niveibacterium umoris]
MRGAFLIAFASSNAVMAINFLGSMWLSRILTPAQIGVFSVAYVITGLLRTLREMGLGTYIVQEPELTDARMRTAFGVSLIVSAAGGLVVLALAIPAAQFYREPGIQTVLVVLGLNFFLVPFGATSMSLMRRNMRFMEIGLIETASALISTIVAVWLAHLGHGYMSLAWSSLVGTLVSVVGVIFFRPSHVPWKPALVEWRRILKVCGYLSGSSLVNYISYSASDLILGRMMTMSAVGYFNRAFGTAGVFSSVIARAMQQVGLPFFAKLHRENEDLRPAFVHATTLVGGLAIPFFAVLMVSAGNVIHLLFGPQWVRSIPLLQILCIASAVEALTYLTNQILSAKGQVQTQWRIDVLGLFVKFGLVIPAALYSLETVALAFVASSVIMNWVRFLALRQFIGIVARDLVTVLAKAAPITVCASTGPALIVFWWDSPRSEVINLMLIAMTAALGWFVAVAAGRHPIRAELVRAWANIRAPKS